MPPNVHGCLLGHWGPIWTNAGHVVSVSAGHVVSVSGSEDHVPGLACHAGLVPPRGHTPPPRLVPLENKQAVTYIPARPGLSLSEGLGLHRHSLCLLCDDCDWTCCLNPSITEHLPAGSSRDLAYPGYWTGDVSPGVRRLRLRQFSIRLGIDDHPLCIRLCACDKSHPWAEFPEVTFRARGNRRF